MSVVSETSPRSSLGVTICQPGTSAPTFDKPFDVQTFMGTWHVVRSTLPMWKTKKDVTITSVPRTGSPPSFDDIVHYRSRNAGANSTPSTVRGVDKQARDGTATAYHWRGSGWLMVASTEWEVIGHGEGWTVTFFAKTLFTPAGLDVYVRELGSMSDERLDDVVRAVQDVSGVIGELAKGFFEVPTSSGE